MKRFVWWSLASTVVLAALLVLAVESWSSVARDPDLRRALYWGGAGGFFINALSYPFMLIMASLPREKVRAGAQWNWWLCGFLARLAGIGALLYEVSGKFAGHEQAVTGMALVVYLAGMATELAWLTRRFNAMDTK